MYIADYTHQSGFFWNSSLTEEEKAQVIAFVETLNEDARRMIDIMLKDAREQAEYDCRGD